MNRTRRLVLLSLISLATLGCDQATKAIAKDSLAARPPVSLLGDSIRLVYTENSGALLSLGAQLDPRLRLLIFVIFAGLTLGALLALILRTRQLTGLQAIGLSLLVGGGAGNVVDRLLHDGEVIDFVHLSYGRLSTGIFNLADVAIFSGFALFALFSLISTPDKSPAG